MPKSTKDTKKHIEEVEEVEEHIEEQISDESEEIEESESEEETTIDEKKKQKKLTASELYSEISTRFHNLIEFDTSFTEKEKEFEKEQKEFQTLRKKVIREMEGYLKRFEKAFNSEVGKKKKPRKTENAGKGGFNKQTVVPEILRNFIGINEDELKSRPEITKLLNAKFNEDGLMKTKKDDNDKEIKIIVLDKATAKKLKRKEGDEIRNKDIQTFIAQFYKEAANITA
jgi:hypothetical protein